VGGSLPREGPTWWGPNSARRPPSQAAVATINYEGQLLAVVAATQVVGNQKTETLHVLTKNPKSGFKNFVTDTLADPKHKALIKTEPDNVLADGTTSRRGVALRYCGELWAKLDPEVKAVYLSAGKEALKAHHLKIGKPVRGDSEDEDGEDGEGSEGSEGGSRSRSRSRSGGAGRKRKHVDMATVSPVDDAPVKHFKHGNKWLLVLGSGKVLVCTKAFVDEAAALASIKLSEPRKASAYHEWKSAKAVAVKAGGELAAHFKVGFTALTDAQKAVFVAMAKAKDAAEGHDVARAQHAPAVARQHNGVHLRAAGGQRHQKTGPRPRGPCCRWPRRRRAGHARRFRWWCPGRRA
jgi:hypothetical protein